MAIELIDIEKSVGGARHLHPTSLTLEAGAFNVLLGVTGAGKTTLIKLMAGLDRPTGGAIRFDGTDVTKASPQKRRVSLVHQFFVNYPHMTVFDNIASPLRVARVDGAEIDRRVRETAELLRLTPMLMRRPQELSGGQQQRTALARAIVKDSSLVLLDEPLANLDYKLREELRDELPRLLSARGAVVVYATSEPTEALLLGGSTATLHEGRVTQFGPTADVYRRPQDLITAEVFSDPPINVASVQKQGDVMRLGALAEWRVTGEAARMADGAYRFGIRPNFVSPRAEVTGAVQVPGAVLVTELSGSESVAHFALGGSGVDNAAERSWVSQTHGVHPFEVGEPHDFYVDVTRGFYFDDAGARVAA